MADNFLYIPYINPVKFYEPDRAVTDTFFTPHFDDFPIAERLYEWQTPADFVQLWQITDIIKLQIESTFDPIVVQLLDSNDSVVIDLPALVGLPNKYYPNTFSYEVAMSLAAVPTGCYRLRILAGPEGDFQRTFLSGWQYVSETPLPNTLLIEYWHNKFHEDVVFETGIKFQVRIHGHFGFMKPGRSEERYKDQRFNPSLLSSRSFRQFDLILGDEFGLPDEMIDLINRICGCNNITIDNKSFSVVEGGQLEFTDAQDYPKRGVKLTVEEGINRGSKIFAVETDTTKKLQYGIVVEAKVWGDTSNQGSNNTVPIITVE